MATKEVVMRPLKDGSGFSPCSASEENVGKRRCNHTASSVSFNVKVNKLGRSVQEVVVSEDYEKLDTRDKKEVISSFISSLPVISKEEADDLIAQLRNM